MFVSWKTVFIQIVWLLVMIRKAFGKMTQFLCLFIVIHWIQSQMKQV